MSEVREGITIIPSLSSLILSAFECITKFIQRSKITTLWMYNNLKNVLQNTHNERQNGNRYRATKPKKPEITSFFKGLGECCKSLGLIA